MLKEKNYIRCKAEFSLDEIIKSRGKLFNSGEKEKEKQIDGVQKVQCREQKGKNGWNGNLSAQFQ